MIKSELDKIFEQKIEVEQKDQVKRKLLYNFITWYNAKPKIQKPKSGLITIGIIEKYLKA